MDKKIKNIIKNVKVMRKVKNAPVDIYGPNILANKSKSSKIYRYQVLISLLLSSQTKDIETAKAMIKLQEYGLNILNINKTPQSKINNLIKNVGFHNKKSLYIKKTTKILNEKYNNDIPNNYKEIISLPGIGQKMCILIMKIAWNQVIGISVDTHVHRISNRLELVKTKTPKQTEIDLEDIVPKKNWKNFNQLFVGFGQQICLPRNPKCNKCKLKKICPYFNSK